MFGLMDDFSQNVKIKVVGMGVSGVRAISYMNKEGIEGIKGDDYIYISGDFSKHGEISNIEKADGIFLDLKEENILLDDLRNKSTPHLDSLFQASIEGSDIVFIVTDLGDTFSSVVAPIFAKSARELGVLAILIASKPFKYRSGKKELGDETIGKLARYIDSYYLFSSDNLIKKTAYEESLEEELIFGEIYYKPLNRELYLAVRSISELITCPGLINVDIADVRVVMQGMGEGAFGISHADGVNRASKAAKKAIRSIKSHKIDISRAAGVLVNVTAGLDLSIGELDEVGTVITEEVDDDATVVVGTVIDSEMSSGEIVVTIFAAGLAGAHEKLFKTHIEEKHYKNIKVVADSSCSDQEIADLILHLSNVYKSVGGDELVIEGVNDLPPNFNSSKKIDSKHSISG